jgi:hypothetical protein
MVRFKHRRWFRKVQSLAAGIIKSMQDRIVMTKMVGSAIAGLLFFITAMFTTMLDLSSFWRNVWLGFCLVFFLLALSGVFILCGDLNSEHSQPDEAKPKEE